MNELIQQYQNETDGDIDKFAAWLESRKPEPMTREGAEKQFNIILVD